MKKFLFLAWAMLIFGLIALNDLAAQPHNCTNQFFVSLYNVSNPNITTFYTVEATSTQVNFNNAFVANAFINAIGFNRLDRYIYAVRRNTGDVIRVAANGDVTTVGTESTVIPEGGWITGAGDVTPDGRYVVNQRPRNSLFIYQVTPTFELLEEVPLVWHPSSGNSGAMDIALDDIVFDPCDLNIAYTFQRGYNGFGLSEPIGTRNRLLRIDMDADSPTYGNAFVIGGINSNIIRHLGAMFFNAQGELFAYGAEDPTSSFIQDRMVKIDPQNADVTLVGTGPGAGGNDGCSCPYTVVIAKRIEAVEYGCESTRISYGFTVINKSYEDLSSLRFRDELPANSTIEAITPADPFGIAPVLNTGLGEREVIYEGFSIANNDTISFQIMISTDAIGIFANQAVLDNLPSFLGDQILSDDPTTDIPNDPTILNIDPADFGNILIESSAMLCPDELIVFGDSTITDAGSFEYTITNPGPDLCDTTYRLTVEEREEIVLNLNSTLCPGELYAWQDTLLSDGFYQFVLPAATGDCDTIVLLELETASRSISNTSITLCEGQAAEVNGMTFKEPGIFELLLPQTSSLGCDSTLVVDVKPPTRIYVPNAFSPLNRDGVNDEVILYTGNSGGRIDRFNIFSRWGDHLYRLEDVEINGSRTTWDGRFRGRLASAGVYVYVLTYTCDNGEEILLKGNIHLVN